MGGADCKCNHPPDDGFSAPPPAPEPPPLPPSAADSLATAEEEIRSAHAEVASAVESALAPISSDLTAARIESDGAIAEAVGNVDNDLRTVATPVNRAITRLSDDTFRALAYAEEDMRAEGVAVPRSPDQLRLDMADETGETILRRLMGESAEPIIDDRLDPRRPPSAPTPPPTSPLDPADIFRRRLDPPAPPAPPPGLSPDDCALPVQRLQLTGDLELVSTSGGDFAVPAHARAVWAVSPYTVEYRILYPPIRDGAPVTYLGADCVIRNLWDEEGRPFPPSGIVPPSSPVPTPPPSPVPPPPGYPCPPPTIITCPPPMPPGAPPCPVADPCPVAPSADVRGTKVRTLPYGIHWSEPQVCDELQRRAFDKGDPASAGHDAEIIHPKGAGAAVKLACFGAFDLLKDIFSPADTKVLTGELVAEATTWALGTAIVAPVWDAVDPIGVPDREATGKIAAKLGLATQIQQRTGIPMEYVTVTERYLMQYSAPQYIPQQPALDLAYLRDAITGDQWRCLTQSHGNIPECAQWVRDVSRAQPNVHEVVALHNRGFIKTQTELLQRLRTLGVTMPAEALEFLELSRYIPTPPEITPLMVRDVFDEDVVKRYNLDFEFETKFFGRGGPGNPGPAAKWARAHGVDADLFKYYWRAHWKMPSPTQLFEMYHRLRPDRPEVIQYDQLLASADDPEAFIQANPPPPVASFADVREALTVDDLTPGWVDRLMAVSYRPMTRTDAIQAFLNGAMDERELYQRFRDTGFDDPTARRMVEIQVTTRDRRIANLTGVWTIRKISQRYLEGSINGAQAWELLTPLVTDPAQREQILSGLQKEMSAQTYKQVLARYRRAVVRAVEEPDDVTAQMQKDGMDREQVRELMRRWVSERDGRYREPTARMIAGWVKQRILHPNEAFKRLIRLGYGEADANMITLGGLVDAAKDARSERKKWEAELKAEIKNAEMARRSSERELTDRQKEIQALVERMRKEGERIQRELERRGQ